VIRKLFGADGAAANAPLAVIPTTAAPTPAAMSDLAKRRASTVS
jgi:hypothetical protein